MDTIAAKRRTNACHIILAAKKKKTSKKTTKKKAKKSSQKCQKCGAWRYCGKKLQNAIDFGLCD